MSSDEGLMFSVLGYLTLRKLFFLRQSFLVREECLKTMISVCRKNPGIRGNLVLSVYLKCALLLFKELCTLQSVHGGPGRDIHANIYFHALRLALQSDLQLSPCSHYHFLIPVSLFNLVSLSVSLSQDQCIFGGPVPALHPPPPVP